MPSSSVPVIRGDREQTHAHKHNINAPVGISNDLLWYKSIQYVYMFEKAYFVHQTMDVLVQVIKVYANTWEDAHIPS